jgi:hypothetical protein
MILAYIAVALLSGPIEPLPKEPPPPAPPPSAVELENLRQLLTLRRVYVDRFGGGETAGQIRDMIITSLQNSKLFIVTENQDKADAILRGSGEDLIYNEQHSSSDNLDVHSNLGISRSDESGALRGGTRTYDRNGKSMGMGAGESESSHSLERHHEANAAVRLVNKDGDVIWSTTQESNGGRFRGSSADVADKVTRQLEEDYARARKLAPAQ